MNRNITEKRQQETAGEKRKNRIDKKFAQMTVRKCMEGVGEEMRGTFPERKCELVPQYQASKNAATMQVESQQSPVESQQSPVGGGTEERGNIGSWFHGVKIHSNQVQKVCGRRCIGQILPRLTVE